MGAGRNPAALGLLFTWTRGTGVKATPKKIYKAKLKKIVLKIRLSEHSSMKIFASK